MGSRWKQFKDGDIIAYTDEDLVVYLIFKEWIGEEEVGYYYWAVIHIGRDCKLMPMAWYAKRSHPATKDDWKRFRSGLEGVDPIPGECIDDFFKKRPKQNKDFGYEDGDLLICETTNEIFKFKRFCSDSTVEFHTCVNIQDRNAFQNGFINIPGIKDKLRFASINEVIKYRYFLINR